MASKAITIKALLEEIDKKKRVIAVQRDQLRTIFLELGDVLDSLERGIDGLETGKREIEDAIDSLSEFL